jgi:DNA-binding NarL/FixJ family response regulator
MDQETGQGIARSLERIAKILAGLLLKDVEDGDQRRKIARLAQCGFQNSEIASINTTANTVGVALHSIRKTKKRKRLR